MNNSKSDSTVCPFCRKENHCMANSEQSCWCNSVKVPAELIALLAENQTGKSCICHACVQAFNEQPEKFAADQV